MELPPNGEIADYLDEVASLYSQSKSEHKRKSASTYKYAADAIRVNKFSVAEMSADELTKTRGIGNSISRAIRAHVDGTQEPQSIVKAREEAEARDVQQGATKFRPGPNSGLVEHLREVSSDKQRSAKRLTDAASEIERRNRKYMYVSVDEVTKSYAFTDDVENAIREYFSPPDDDEDDQERSLSDVPDLEPATVKHMKSVGITSVKDALFDSSIPLVDKKLIFWSEDLRTQPTESDLYDISVIISDLTDTEAVPRVSSNNNVIIVVPNPNDTLVLISPYVRCVMYSDPGDVTVLFQSSARAKVRIVRLRSPDKRKI
jgi:phenylpyruvate tautomerase PptA (4-oxalocrotonate tautomerase family)